MSLSLFLDEEELNPHEVAWMDRDWDAVDSLTKEYQSDKKNELFMLLDEINFGKKRVPVGTLDSYSKYMIDSALSQHPDTLYTAYVMNIIGSGLSDQTHFDYCLLNVRKERRSGAWAKLVEEPEEKIILRLMHKLYNVNDRVAMEYVEELTQLNKLEWFKSTYKNVALDLVGDVVKSKAERKKVEQKIKKW